MKIIFLDIDGVLNYQGCKSRTPSGLPFLEEVNMKYLKEIIDSTEAKIVLSSTWRYGYFALQEGRNSLAAKDYIMLKNKLNEYGIEIFSHTPYLREKGRVAEIMEWLIQNKEGVERLVILDDKENMNPLGICHVKTDIKCGLQEKDVIKAIRILNQI